jgi:hypothetical protein
MMHKNSLVSIKIEQQNQPHFFENNAVETITFFKQVDGDIYPDKDLPENARKLRGLVWRGDERIKIKEDIFRMKTTTQ